MTTSCLPCELAAAAEATTEIVPEQDVDAPKGAFWAGPIGLESEVTGDGRLIKANALRWDTLPVPLRYAPQDFGAHDGAYVVGKITAIERLTYDETNERLEASGRPPLPEDKKDSIIIWGSGMYDTGSEIGREAFRHVGEELTPGISMDLDDIVIEETDADAVIILEGRVRAATQVAIPAFEGARIAVSDEVSEVLVASGVAATASLAAHLAPIFGEGFLRVSAALFDQARDEGRVVEVGVREDDGVVLYDLDPEAVFNWVDEVGGLPPYIKRIKKHLVKKGMDESHAIATAVNVVKKMCATGDTNFPGAQEVNAGSRAEACAAVADWEEKKARAKSSAAESLTASADLGRPPAAWFRDPGLSEPTPLTVTPDGRVFGHIALWGTCHIASPQGHGVCTEPPRSYSNYAYFNTHPVETDEGDVYTGRLTMNTLHAGARLSATDTVHHYEHTGAVGAHVVAGEDALGIWVAGAAHPKADLRTLKASPVSGDWREQKGALELMGVLSVNVPGFPVPRPRALVASGERMLSLVASGVLPPTGADEAPRAGEAAMESLASDPEFMLKMYGAFKEMDRRERAAALAARVRRLSNEERVRRVRLAVGDLAGGSADQWRVPKGNGPGSGQWIDMPDSLLGPLEDAVSDMLAEAGEGFPEGPVRDALSDVSKNVKATADALRAGDGPAASDAAGTALDGLSDFESDVDGLKVDGVLDEAKADDIAGRIEELYNGLKVVDGSDLSLLGDEGIGAGEGGDVGDGPASTVGVPDNKASARVARLAASLGFAYNPDQWRVPKGNGELSGRFIDMPDVAVGELSDALTDIAEGSALDDAAAGRIGENLDKAMDASKRAADALRAGDGPGATSAADEADDALSKIEADLQDAADSGSLDEGSAADIGEKLGGARDSIGTVKDSDLSLLGDEGPGGEGGDIGSEDPKAPEASPGDVGGGDAPAPDAPAPDAPAPAPDAPDAPAPDGPEPGGSAQQKAGDKVVASTDALAANVGEAAEGELPEDKAPAIGEALDALQDAMYKLNSGIKDGDFRAGDLDAAQEALSSLESLLMDAADGPGLSDETADRLGQMLDTVFDDLGALADLLKGETAPPPFSLRDHFSARLARRSLGRRTKARG